MTKKSAFIRARTEPELKKRAEAVFRHVGLTPSDAINLLYRQAALRGEVPLELKLPNEVTRRAIEDARAGRKLIEAKSATELFELLEDE